MESKEQREERLLGIKHDHLLRINQGLHSIHLDDTITHNREERERIRWDLTEQWNKITRWNDRDPEETWNENLKRATRDEEEDLCIEIKRAKQ